MKQTQVQQESKLDVPITDFFSKKPKTVPQSASVVSEEPEEPSVVLAHETTCPESPVTSTSSTDRPTGFPDIWTTNQWVQKKKDYPWLDCRDGKLG